MLVQFGVFSNVTQRQKPTMIALAISSDGFNLLLIQVLLCGVVLYSLYFFPSVTNSVRRDKIKPASIPDPRLCSIRALLISLTINVILQIYIDLKI